MMANQNGKPTTDDWQLAEYNALKSEQRDRIKYRDGLFFAAFVFYGALGGYALLPQSPVDAWLILGFVAGLAGHMYLENEVKISGIRDYLKPKYKELLGWETEIDAESRRGIRKFFQMLVDLAAFGGASVFSFVLAWPHQLVVLPSIVKGLVGVLGLYVVVRTLLRYRERYL